jgi:hypothetical protein
MMTRPNDFQHCCKTLRDERVQFIGVIDKMGNLVAGHFNNMLQNVDTRMMCMQNALAHAMRKESESILGKLEYTAVKRDRTLLLNIPFHDYLISILSKPQTSEKELVAMVIQKFTNHLTTVQSI